MNLHEASEHPEGQEPHIGSEGWIRLLDQALSEPGRDPEFPLPGIARHPEGLSQEAFPGEIRRGGGISSPLRYRITGILGRGANARLYRAFDEDLKRSVALKLLEEPLLYDIVARHRFLKEGEILANLQHPNLVALYDRGELEGRPYLVMELVEGVSLERLLREKVQDRHSLLKVFVQAARGVAAAHAHGVVHRDLKPEHILVTPADEAKVCDFGIASAPGSPDTLTRPGTLLGTPLYMAPEQAKGGSRDASPQTDVYSLGCILYEILTGRPAFGEENIVELYGKVIRDDPPRPRELDRHLSRSLEAIVLKAMDKNAAGRYPTAGELADDVERYLGGQPVEARPLSTLNRLWKQARRRSRFLVSLAAALILGIAPGTWGLWRAHRTSMGLTSVLAQAEEWERQGNLDGAYYAFRTLELIDQGNVEAREGVQRLEERVSKTPPALTSRGVLRTRNCGTHS